MRDCFYGFCSSWYTCQLEQRCTLREPFHWSRQHTSTAACQIRRKLPHKDSTRCNSRSCSAFPGRSTASPTTSSRNHPLWCLSRPCLEPLALIGKENCSWGNLSFSRVSESWSEEDQCRFFLAEDSPEHPWLSSTPTWKDQISLLFQPRNPAKKGEGLLEHKVQWCSPA